MFTKFNVLKKKVKFVESCALASTYNNNKYLHKISVHIFV